MQGIDRYRSLLCEIIPFQSVSTDPAFANEMERTAAWYHDLFEQHGFTVSVEHGYGNPVLTARYDIDPRAETVLLYGHYDVQPATNDEGWDSDPFTVREENDRFYGRGTCDNKGQSLIHIVSVFDLIENGELGYNVVFLLEGDEENGSPFLAQYLNDHADILQADIAFVSDGEISGGQHTIELGFRGTFNATVSIHTAPSDLHSGLFGSTVPSAAHAAARFVTHLHDEDGKVTVPGFYDHVEEPAPSVHDMYERLFDDASFKRLTGVKVRAGEREWDPFTQAGLRPSLEVTGFHVGYTGTGYRNSIPAAATVKVNIRLVPHQDPATEAERFRAFAQNSVPDARAVHVDIEHPVPPTKLAMDTRPVRTAARAIESVTGAEPLYKYCGGTLPIAHHFDHILGLDQVYVPFANEDCAMHGVNENITEACVKNGLAISTHFLRYGSSEL